MSKHCHELVFKRTATGQSKNRYYVIFRDNIYFMQCVPSWCGLLWFSTTSYFLTRLVIIWYLTIHLNSSFAVHSNKLVSDAASCLYLSLLSSVCYGRFNIFHPFFFIMQPRNLRNVYLFLIVIYVYLCYLFFIKNTLVARNITI